jgi:large subunit ribosomal protein L35
MARQGKIMARQKLKTHKGVKKRFRKTGTGKLMRNQANKRHILTSKSPGRKRRLRRPRLVAPGDVYRIAALLPS